MKKTGLLDTGAKLSGAQRWFSALAGFGGLSSAKCVDAGIDLGKAASLSRNINTVVNYVKTMRNLTIALTGDDPFTKEKEDMNGVSRIVAGLNTPFADVVPVIGRLDDSQLRYVTAGYQLGAALTGKEGVFFGGDLSEDERWSVGVNGAAPFVYAGLSYAYHKASEAYLNSQPMDKLTDDQIVYLLKRTGEKDLYDEEKRVYEEETLDRR